MLHSFFHSYDLFKQIFIFLWLFSLLVDFFMSILSLIYLNLFLLILHILFHFFLSSSTVTLILINSIPFSHFLFFLLLLVYQPCPHHFFISIMVPLASLSILPPTCHRLLFLIFASHYLPKSAMFFFSFFVFILNSLPVFPYLRYFLFFSYFKLFLISSHSSFFNFYHPLFQFAKRFCLFHAWFENIKKDFSIPHYFHSVWDTITGKQQNPIQSYSCYLHIKQTIRLFPLFFSFVSLRHDFYLRHAKVKRKIWMYTYGWLKYQINQLDGLSYFL